MKKLKDIVGNRLFIASLVRVIRRPAKPSVYRLIDVEQMTDRIPSVFRFFQNVFILRIFVFVFNHFERSIFRERGELRGATRASRHPKHDRNFLFASFSTSFTRFSSSSVFKEHVKHVRVVRRSIQLKIPRRAFQRRSVSITRRLLFLV